MAEIKPIEASDLNGVELDAREIAIDSLAGYVGFVRNLCTDLGTKNDSPEGQQDYQNFIQEIQAAKISVFEPDSIDDNHSFDNLDLLGENDPIPPFPLEYFASYNGILLGTNTMNNGLGASPFDCVGCGKWAPTEGPGISPFDIIGNMKLDPVGQSLG
jgi:hypothetical protein